MPTSSLEGALKSLFTWFDNNLTKSYADKCHLLVSSNEKVTIKTVSHEFANITREKLVSVHLFSVHLVCGLSFDYHISETCKKASRKVRALARVTSSMSLSKKHTLRNMFFKLQFNYCPLIWVCHNNKNRLHERYLRILYNDKQSSFNALLEKDGSVSIDERNIKILAKEMFKVSKNLKPPQMQEIFKLKDQPHYNLRYNSLCSRPLVVQSIKVLKIYRFYNQKSGILTRICLI